MRKRPRHRERLAASASVVAMLIGGFGCSGREEPSSERRPWNVLVISIDTLRADYVSAYGHGHDGRSRTPHIDRLADEGVMFETVQAVAPTTLPSHASLFTGLTPPRHGLRDNVGYYLSPDVPTLAARLSASGYRTGAFVGAFVLDSRFGLDQGFDTYFDDFEEEDVGIAAGLVSHRRGRDVLEPALEWLERRAPEPEEPFFAFLHFYDPHAPYEAPGGGDGPPEARYREEVAYVDGLVGELLAWLDTSGEASRTVVVLTSDHGESLGEHGEDTHGLFVYQSTLSVPWLLRFPGGPRGARIGGLASTVDVAPTVLDLLGLPGLEDVDGRSLRPAWQGGGAPAESSGYAYAESFVSRVHFGWSELRSVRDERYKLILAPRVELYDLDEDPGETTNLATRASESGSGAESGRMAALSQAAEAYLGNGPASGSALTLDRESLERLRSLGYAGGGTIGEGSASTVTANAADVDPKDRVEVYELLVDATFSEVAPSDGARFAEVLRRLESAIESDPGIPRAHLLHGELLLRSGDTERAREAFERLVALDEGSFDGHYGLAMTLAREGRLDAATQELERARELEPRNAKTYFQLSEIAMLRGDADAAERWLREAMEQNTDRVLVERLAQVLVAGGKREEGRRLLVDLAERYPEDPLAAYNLAQMLLIEGEAEQALVQFRRATELVSEAAPDSDPDPDPFQGMGNALVNLGRLEEAVGAYGRAIAIAPCFTQALSNLGSVLLQLGRLGEAVERLEEAIRCDPSYVRAYQNLAAVHMERGELESAIAVLRDGIAASPEGADELTPTLLELERYQRSR